jgi:hypothetical protein
MGQHKRQEPQLSLKIGILCFVGGALLVVGSVCEFIYRPHMGFFGTRATGRMLVLGVMFMTVPAWSYLRRKKQQRSATANRPK